MAVIVAALMSDLDSIFNCASTLFTIDIWKGVEKEVFRERADDSRKVTSLVLIT